MYPAANCSCGSNIRIVDTWPHLLIIRNNTRNIWSLPCPEGSVTPISEKELHVVTNIADGDTGRNQSVVFAVTSPPKLGRLVRRMPDNSTRNISTFTQSMVWMCVSVCVSFFCVLLWLTSEINDLFPHLFVSLSLSWMRALSCMIRTSQSPWDGRPRTLFLLQCLCLLLFFLPTPSPS